jgi:hypothetical protein
MKRKTFSSAEYETLCVHEDVFELPVSAELSS